MNLKSSLFIPVLLMGFLSSCAMNPAGLWIQVHDGESFSLSLSPDNRFFISDVLSNGRSYEDTGRWLVSNRILSCISANGNSRDWEILDLSGNKLELVLKTKNGKTIAPIILRPVSTADFFGIWYAPNKLNLGFSKGGVFVISGTNLHGQQIFSMGHWDYADGKLTAQTQNKQKRRWHIVFFYTDKMALKTQDDGSEQSSIEKEYKRLGKSEWIGTWKQGISEITFRDDGYYTTSGVNFEKAGTYQFSGRTLQLQQDSGKSTDYEVLIYSIDKIILKNIGSPIESIWLRKTN